VYFDDRIDAARQLADALRGYRGQDPLVLAVPRGAVPMGAELARQLGGDLDVVLVKKLPAPGNPELAIGAVDETGWSYVADYAAETGAHPAYIDAQRREQLRLLAARRALYTPGKAGFDPAGRIAIVVDDGLATGATMIAALHSVRAHKPARLVCAVPIAAASSIAKVRPYADELVCVEQPLDFGAVGRFYRDFSPVSDEEVAAILQQARRGAFQREATT